MKTIRRIFNSIVFWYSEFQGQKEREEAERIARIEREIAETTKYINDLVIKTKADVARARKNDSD